MTALAKRTEKSTRWEVAMFVNCGGQDVTVIMDGSSVIFLLFLPPGNVSTITMAPSSKGSPLARAVAGLLWGPLNGTPF